LEVIVKKLLFILFISLPAFVHCGFFRRCIDGVTTSYRTHKVQRLGRWAQTEVGIPKEKHCKVYIANPQTDPDDAYSSYSRRSKRICFGYENSNAKFGSQKFTLLHEAVHRKQDIEGRSFMSVYEAEREADEIALHKIGCYKCLQEKIIHQINVMFCLEGNDFEEYRTKLSIEVFQLLQQKLLERGYFLQSIIHYDDCLKRISTNLSLKALQQEPLESGYLSVSACRERAQQLKEEGLRCPTHWRYAIYKAMMQHMAEYGLW